MHPYLTDQRLRKDERLLRKAQFDAVFKQGRGRGDRRVVVHVLSNDLGHPRLGLVVSRRFGNAVARNRFKRRVREWFRRNKAAIGSRDVVVLPARHPDAQTASTEDLHEALARLLTQPVKSA
jgi:ribonuclease P protein component